MVEISKPLVHSVPVGLEAAGQGFSNGVFPKPHLDDRCPCLGTLSLEQSGQAPRRPHASVILALSR